MENFLFTSGVILPLFIIIFIGYLTKYFPFMSNSVLGAINALVLRLFFPITLFLNIYHANLEITKCGYLVYLVFGTIVVALISSKFYPFITKDGKQIAVLAMSTFRSNYTIFGIYLAERMLGGSGVASIAIGGAFILPVTNIGSVVLFECYGRQSNEKARLLQVFLLTLKNPLIIGSFLGFLANVSGIFLPATLDSALQDLGACTTPVALIVLGAQFKFSGFYGTWKCLVWGTMVRMFVVPAAAISIAVFIGFSGAELLPIMVHFSAPSAVSGYIMAAEAGMDGRLAGRLVVTTSITSLFTMFAIIWILRSCRVL